MFVKTLLSLKKKEKKIANAIDSLLKLAYINFVSWLDKANFDYTLIEYKAEAYRYSPYTATKKY